jgi:DNA replication protein DnaC
MGIRYSLVGFRNDLARRYEMMSPGYADAMLDRLVRNAHRIDLAGDSLRRRRSRSIAKD